MTGFVEGKAQGDYKIEQMMQMATVAQTADGIEVSGNNFKVNALLGCPDMVLFACENIKFLESRLEAAKVDAIATFGAELVNEYESNFSGGENQILAICQVVSEKIKLQPASHKKTKPELGVDCVIWCAGEPKIDRLTDEDHHEAYWAESLYAFGDEDKFLILEQN